MFDDVVNRIAKRLGKTPSEDAYIVLKDDGRCEMSLDCAIDGQFDPEEYCHRWLSVNMFYRDEMNDDDVKIGNICICVHNIENYDVDMLGLYELISGDQIECAYIIEEEHPASLCLNSTTVYVESIDLDDCAIGLGIEEEVVRNLNKIVQTFMLVTPEASFGIALPNEKPWAFASADFVIEDENGPNAYWYKSYEGDFYDE